MEYNQRIEVRISKEMRRQIKAIASKLSVKESELIRIALNGYITGFDKIEVNTKR